jgi:NAD(P)-dependent dehydrogenase (short-subunit alcohol dehydrogenase family)
MFEATAAMVAVVTGASRGAGRGIAIALGAHGCTVYVTGRSEKPVCNDPKLMEMSGQTVIGAEMAMKYGIKDLDGRQPQSYRDTHKVAPRVQYPKIIR